MAGNWSNWYWKLRLASVLAMSGAIIASGNCALAQITPDNTLPTNSRVTSLDSSGVPVDRIDDETIRGANLFHSFLEFNVREGRGAYFTNPSGIENILSRVTGNDPSDILGTLGVLGNANLFLMNPNGIIFGEKASLDVGGSFIATTANAIRLGNTGQFSASEPETSNLLTVNPSALFFNAVGAQRQIVNQSQASALNSGINVVGGPTGLQVPAGQTLALVGGDVLLEKGNLIATGGRIELGSVAGVGEVGLSQVGNSWVLRYDSVNTFGNIRLEGTVAFEDTTVVDVSGDGSGSVAINARNLDVLEGSILAAGILSQESVNSKVGNVEINATETTTLSESSFVVNHVFSNGVGNSGDIGIETQRLVLTDGSQVGAIIFGSGNAGDLTVRAFDSVELSGRGPSFPSGLFADVNSDARGQGGNLTIETGSLSVADGGQISSSTYGQGNAGGVNILANNQIALGGSNGSGYILNSVNSSEAVGSSKGINITTGSLFVENASQIRSQTLGRGDIRQYQNCCS